MTASTHQHKELSMIDVLVLYNN